MESLPQFVFDKTLILNLFFMLYRNALKEYKIIR